MKSPSLNQILRAPSVIFEEEGHTYKNTQTGEFYTGCTTIANSLEKDFMAPWYAKEAVKALGYFDETELRRNFPDETVYAEKLKEAKLFLSIQKKDIGKITVRQYYEKLEHCKGEARRKGDAAKVSGTLAHEMIENAISSLIGGGGMRITGGSENLESNNAYNAFYNWYLTRTPVWLACEETICSDVYKIGGRIDGLASINGIPEILDIKTSGQISESYFLQLAGYDIMLREMGFTTMAWRIVRTPKDGTPAQEARVSDPKFMQFCRDTFLHLREAHKFGLYIDSHFRENGRGKIIPELVK